MTKPEFRKWKSINKFSDAFILANKVSVKDFVYRGKIKLHGCFEKNTDVTLANGEKEKISNLTSGTQILSYNEESKSIEIDEVVNVIATELDKKWLELTFSDGSYLKCTEDHLFLTRNRGWVEAKCLTESDIFVTETD